MDITVTISIGAQADVVRQAFIDVNNNTRGTIKTALGIS